MSIFVKVCAGLLLAIVALNIPLTAYQAGAGMLGGKREPVSAIGAVLFVAGLVLVVCGRVFGWW